MKPNSDFAIASAATFIVDANGCLLVGKRIAKTTVAGKHDWCLPGGKVDWNETVEQAAIREIKEECGLEIKEENLNFLEYKKENYPVFGGYYVCFYFYTKYLSPLGCDVCEPDKISHWLWEPCYDVPFPLFGEASNVLSRHYNKIFP